MAMMSLGDFYGIDSLIDLMIAFVSFIIFYYSNKIYKVVKEDSYRLFSYGFFAISLSYVFKIIANLTVLYTLNTHSSHFLVDLFEDIGGPAFIHFFSYIIYQTLHIIGFLMIFFMLTKTSNREKMFLFVYFSFVVVILSVYFNFIFHLSLFLIIAILTIHYNENYNKRKTQNALIVLLGFSLMLLGHLNFIFLGISPIVYLAGEFLMFIGFLLLLVNQIKLKNEQKKDETGSHKRHSRHT